MTSDTSFSKLQNWFLFCILAIAFVLRFYDLGSKPLHHDEAIHAMGAWSIWWTGGGYSYNPTYHGPLMYYLTALSMALFGDTDVTVRMPQAIFGTLLCASPLLLRRQLGRWGTVLACGGFAVSAVSLYMSRYFRMDMAAALFNILAVAFACRWAAKNNLRDLAFAFLAYSFTYCTKEISFITAFVFVSFLLLALLWDSFLSGKPPVPSIQDLGDVKKVAPWAKGAGGAFGICLIVGAGQLMANPYLEAAGLAVLVMSLMVVCYLLSVPVDNVRVVSLATGVILTLAWMAAFYNQDTFMSLASLEGRAFLMALNIAGLVLMIGLVSWQLNSLRLGLFGFCLFMIPFTLFFTSFFDNPKGFSDGLYDSLYYWLTQQDVARGDQPWFYYLGMLPANEPLLAVAALPAALYVIISKKSKFALFLVYWFVVSFLLYSIAGEKMPWLNLHLVQPLILLTAYAGGRLIEARGKNVWLNSYRWAGFAGALLLFLLSVRISFGLSFIRPADPSEVMVYTQSHRDVVEASYLIRELAYRERGHTDGESGDKKLNDQQWREEEKKPFIIIEDDCSWPLTWYLRNMSNRIRVHPADLGSWRAPIIITPTTDDKSRIQALEADGYTTVLGHKDHSEPFRSRLRMRWWWRPYNDPSITDLVTYLIRREPWEWKSARVYRDEWDKKQFGSTDMRVWISREVAQNLKKYPISYFPGKKYR